MAASVAYTLTLGLMLMLIIGRVITNTRMPIANESSRLLPANETEIVSHISEKNIIRHNIVESYVHLQPQAVHRVHFLV